MYSSRYVASRIDSLACCDCDDLATGIGKGRVHECGKHTKKPSGASDRKVLVHRTWVSPILKAQPVTLWPCSEVDYNTAAQQPHNSHNLDRGKDKLLDESQSRYKEFNGCTHSLAIATHRKDVKSENRCQDHCDPQSRVDLDIPKVDHDRCR